MCKHRMHQVVLVVSLTWLSWLGMMLVHESGHVIFALCTGGHIQRVIWHPLALSRTDVQPDPSPLAVVWGGPIVGTAAPFLIMLTFIGLRRRVAYVFVFFAGFCILANGLYIGAGVVFPVGDAHEMLRLGTPRWTLAVFGISCAILGLQLLDHVSPRLGLGSKPVPNSEKDVYSIAAAAIVVTCIGLVVGNRGY